MVSSINAGMSGTNPLQQAMRQLFAKNDENVDGKLDSSEISSLLNALGTTSDSDSSLTADRVIEAFDSDGDGQVTGSEFDSGFKKLAESMQGTMIAMQEGAGRPMGPPPGPPPGQSSEEDEEDDSTTVSDLMKLLESYSQQDEDETASTEEASSTDSLLQTFLSQLEQYAQNQSLAQEQRFGYRKTESGVSVSV